MDNTTFVNLLTATAPTELRILGLAAELTGPDGVINLEGAAGRQEEIEQACAEAEAYASSTTRLARAMVWKALPRRR